jgi:release factor glutamine methyltransferase
VVGWAEFCGRRIATDPGVFVPRRRTEFLVEQAALVAAHPDRPLIVVDLCCGTGAVGVALAEALKDVLGLKGVELHAADIDPAAVRCARRNVQPIGGKVYEGDLDSALPQDLRGRVDILVANAPYVPTAEIALLPSEARDNEPRTSLDGGTDGTDVQQRIIAVAGGWLAPAGRLLTETTTGQLSRLLNAIREHGLLASTAQDEERDATVAIGTAR